MITTTKNQGWRTPRAVFDALHREYDFTVDAAASIGNRLLPTYWTRAHDALSKDLDGHRAFINPPFGKIWDFLAWGHRNRDRGLSCFLLPANVETDWFHCLAVDGDKHLFRSRVAYDPPVGVALDGVSAPSFASILVFFGPSVTSTGYVFSAIRDGKTGERIDGRTYERIAA